MPNWCTFIGAVSGYHSNVDAFINILYNDYDELHFYRTILDSDSPGGKYGLYKKQYFYGECAWSIASCMLAGYGIGSYYDQDLTEHLRNMLNHKPVNPFLGTHLLEQAKRLNLTIELYGTEPGMAFCEYIKILPAGIVAHNDSGMYEEWWIADFRTYQEMIDEYGIKDISKIPFTEAEFNQMKASYQECYKDAAYEFEDTIPEKPNYLAKLRMYHLKNPNEIYDPNRFKDSRFSMRFYRMFNPYLLLKELYGNTNLNFTLS